MHTGTSEQHVINTAIDQ